MPETTPQHPSSDDPFIGPKNKIEIQTGTTQRDTFELGLKELFQEKLIPVEQAASIIGQFKDGSFAMSQMGMMLYTNGYNLRGRSTHFPNGMVYYDGKVVFGVGYFAKEGEQAGHLMIVAPKGKETTAAVQNFIALVRQHDLSNASVYVRHLNPFERDDFMAAGMKPIETDPWHPEAMEEDEHYPNRVFDLDQLIELREDGRINIKTLHTPEDAGHKRKNRMAYKRFGNFLDRNKLRMHIEPYNYTVHEVGQVQQLVQIYFDARRRRGGVVGSTPEDYFALIRQRPAGANEQDYFAYQVRIEMPDGGNYLMAFFAGEKLAPDKVGLYATITLRFEEYVQEAGWDMQGFTAIPQYVWINIFAKLRANGVKIVDAGGSETQSLDDQKRQLGGKAQKSYWVVDKSKDHPPEPSIFQVS